MDGDSSKKLIQKKDENVIFGSFQRKESPSKKERGSVLRAQNEDQFYHPSFSGSGTHHQQHPRLEKKDLWMGFSSTACLVMVLCGITVMNVKNKGLRWQDSSRTLASFDNDLNALDTREMKREQEIIRDLHTGRRDLASIRPSPSLLKKENFEHNVLKSYHLFFSENKAWLLKEARLQPDQNPIFIPSADKFIEEHQDFFPPHKDIEVVKTFSEGGVHELMYRLSGAGDVSYFEFRLNADQKLLSIAWVENHR